MNWHEWGFWLTNRSVWFVVWSCRNCDETLAYWRWFHIWKMTKIRSVWSIPTVDHPTSSVRRKTAPHRHEMFPCAWNPRVHWWMSDNTMVWQILPSHYHDREMFDVIIESILLSRKDAIAGIRRVARISSERLIVRFGCFTELFLQLCQNTEDEITRKAMDSTVLHVNRDKRKLVEERTWIEYPTRESSRDYPRSMLDLEQNNTLWSILTFLRRHSNNILYYARGLSFDGCRRVNRRFDSRIRHSDIVCNARTTDQRNGAIDFRMTTNHVEINDFVVVFSQFVSDFSIGEKLFHHANTVQSRSQCIPTRMEWYLNLSSISRAKIKPEDQLGFAH